MVERDLKFCRAIEIKFASHSDAARDVSQAALRDPQRRFRVAELRAFDPEIWQSRLFQLPAAAFNYPRVAFRCETETRAGDVAGVLTRRIPVPD